MVLVAHILGKTKLFRPIVKKFRDSINWEPRISLLGLFFQSLAN